MTPEFADWLDALAKDGGKGVVGNIDARCLGRVAALLRKQAAEVERLQELLRGTGANRYWEGRWRDEKADNERLTVAVRDAHGLIDNDLVIPWIMAHKLDDVLGIHKP